jgi:ABC-type antimicrobial peptide transport system ATPase subunit
MNVYSSKLGIKQAKNLEHRFCRPIGRVSVKCNRVSDKLSQLSKLHSQDTSTLSEWSDRVSVASCKESVELLKLFPENPAKSIYFSPERQL